jgi:hypothetical protein
VKSEKRKVKAVENPLRGLKKNKGKPQKHKKTRCFCG